MLQSWIRSFALTVITTCLFTAGGYAANAPAEVEAKSASDTLATDISAALVIANPGHTLATPFGHCSIHMSCPSAGLDNYYTYLIFYNLKNVRQFFAYGACSGFYTMMKRDEFLRDYIEGNRTVTEYTLNLTTDEVRHLWMNLDREAYNPLSRTYTLLYSQCASISADVISHSLVGERIDLSSAESLLPPTLREFACESSARNVWMQLFLVSIIGQEGERPGKLAEKLTPETILPVWNASTFVATDGSRRPIFTGESQVLYEGSSELPTPSPFTPMVAFIILLVLTIAVTLAERCHHLKGVAKGLDIVLLTAQTLLGLFFCYLYLFSKAPWAPDNWLVVVLNPLPLLLWIPFHRKPWFRWVYLVYAIVLLVFIIATLCAPQFMPALAVLFAVWAVRCIHHFIPIK